MREANHYNILIYLFLQSFSNITYGKKMYLMQNTDNFTSMTLGEESNELESEIK